MITESDNINIGHSSISKLSSGIIQIIASDHTYGVDDIKEIHESIIKLSNGKKSPLMFIASEFTSFDIDAKNYITNPKSNMFGYAKAFVIKSLAQRLLMNTLLKIKGVHLPTRFFTDKSLAEKWLIEQKEIESN